LKKILLSTIIITAIVTFFVTKHFSNAEHNHHSSQNHDAHDDHEKPAEGISTETLSEFGVEIDIASGGTLLKTFELPGEVQIDPDRLAHITPRFNGVVKKVFKQIGHQVKKGEVLAIIESNESLTPYELKSSINGVIIDMHLTKGETVQNTENFVAVANLSEVWVNLNVYQKYLSKLKIGQAVNVIINPELPKVSGIISFISSTINKHTRTATARVVLSNTNGWLRPGQFVTGLVTVDKSNCKIMIPKTAIETIKGLPVVFAKDKHGLEPIHIKVGKKNSEFVEVLSGLSSGQQYVKKGGFILKAQMAKSSFGGGHSH
jgi:membrane fusion protein, heavy metal efflux system